MTEFGKWLLGRRKEKNFTQGDLADRLGMHVRSITQWELGRGLPNRNNLRRIAAFFQVDPEDLLAAVFRKSGCFPAPERNGMMEVPGLMSERLKRVAAAAGMEPMEWLDLLLTFVEIHARDVRRIFSVPVSGIAPGKVLGATLHGQSIEHEETASEKLRR